MPDWVSLYAFFWYIRLKLLMFLRFMGFRHSLSLHNAFLWGVNLNGCNLSSFNLEKANLERANLKGANLKEANLERANLKGANLEEANLERANLSKCDLEFTNLKKAKLGGVILKEANLSGVNFSVRTHLGGANLSKCNLRCTKLEEANLDSANLDSANLEEANFRKAHLAGANLSKCNLRCTNLEEANLDSANLEEAKLERANFHKAHLAGANLSKCNLRCTYLEEANLNEANLKETNLSDVDFSSIYLSLADLSSANLRGANLSRKDFRNIDINKADLSSANLRGANLSRKDFRNSFIGTKFYQSSLKEANLTGALLVRTQFESTDLTGATLTGACIENWVVTRTTKLNGIKCKYIFMKYDANKRDQMPLKGEFKDGEFILFVRAILDTLELYHERDINPRAAVIVLKSLSEEYNEPLQIIGLERRGNAIILKLKTSEWTNQEELKKEYDKRYNQILTLPMEDPNKLLPRYEVVETAPVLSKFTEVVEKFKQHPTTYIEYFYNEGLYMNQNSGIVQRISGSNVYGGIQASQGDNNQQTQETDIDVGTMTNNPGGFSVGGSVGGNVNNVQGDNNRAVQGDNNQAVLGDNNQVMQQNQVGADTSESLTKEDVVKLLAQLETLIKGAELPADTKEEVVEDLSAVKKATDKEEPNKKRALDRLTSVAETIEKTTKTVDSSKKLWDTAKPIIVKIAGWLGAAGGSHLWHLLGL